MPRRPMTRSGSCASGSVSPARCLPGWKALGGLRRAAFWLSAAAVVAGIVIAAEYLSQPYAYINGRPVRDAETAMQTTMYLRQLSVFDRSVQTFENAIKPENNE